ncbi:MAG TPA: amino acid permease [Gammaproteobacteria bacterium]|nr:amino acid permease [Gammaproteobacteria bacterium]
MTTGVSASGNRVLSVFSLVMINVIAVDSLRTLPLSAKFGSTLIFYYVVLALLFFIPVALVTAELATTWPKKGGIYVWVREAFGHSMGFLVIWLQWVYNIVWYPAILATIAVIFSYLIDPHVPASPVLTVSIVLVVFWLSTLGNFFGMQVSSLISTIGSIIGTIVPMLAIIALGIWWVVTKHGTPQIELTWDAIIPQIDSISDLALVTTMIFGLMGLEMSAVHAQEVKNPKCDYPVALSYSGVIIVLTLLIGSLAVALVVPNRDLNIVTGVIQAFKYFCVELHAPWLLPGIAIAIIIGAVGSIAAWIIGPTKGLLVAAQEDNLPKIFAYTNAKGVPVAILIVQGVIVSLLSLLYVLLPTIETAYLVLTQLTAILALLMYVLMFVAAITLRYRKPDIERPYKIPFGNAGMWFIGTLGAVSSFMAMCLGFVPPSQVMIGDPMLYQLLLVCGVALFCIPAFFIHKRARR